MIKLVFNNHDKELIKNNMDNIPDSIFDIHTHVFLSNHLNQDLYNCLFYKEFSFQDLSNINNIIFPWKRISNVCFWQPQIWYNNGIFENNNYIKAFSKLWFLLYNKYDDINIQKEIQESAYWKWLKVYCFKAISIITNLSFSMLQILNMKKLPLLLHLPNNIITDEKELEAIAKTFPNINIIIAHGGNIQKCKNDFDNYKISLRNISTFNNIWFDVSWINHQYFMKLLLENFDKNRILYWSDLPISLFKWLVLPWKNWTIRFITNNPSYDINYRINNTIIKNLNLDLSKVINIQQYNIQLLRENLSLKDRDSIFYKNVQNLF